MTPPLISMVLVTAALILHFVVVSRRQGIATLDGIFVIAQWILAVGTLAILNSSDQRDSEYASVVSVPMIIYSCLSIFIYVTHLAAPIHERVVSVLTPTPALVTLLCVSVALTIAYFQAVGYNVFLLGLDSLASGAKYDYATLRLASYTGNRYLFPGYVNQFKNVILPSMAIVIAFYCIRTRRPFYKTLTTALVCVALVGLLGTGQRGAFVQYALTLLTFLYLLDRKAFRKRGFIALAVVLPLFAFATVLLGRSRTLSDATAGVSGQVGALVSQILSRFFFDNQSTGQAAFRYTASLPTQWGAEWLQSLSNILPGKDSGVSLSTVVFKIMYGGSDRGTAPPSMWGSVHYNFGWAGLILFPIVLAIVFQAVTRRAISKAQVNQLELVGMSGVFIIFGTWIAGGPEYLLNAGGLTFAVLWWLGRRFGRHAGESSEVEKLAGHTAPIEPFNSQFTVPKNKPAKRTSR